MYGLLHTGSDCRSSLEIFQFQELAVQLLTENSQFITFVFGCTAMAFDLFFQDFPVLEFSRKKIQDFPGGVGTQILFHYRLRRAEWRQT